VNAPLFADDGFAEAQLRLGRMLLSGEDARKDEEAAFAWFARAAEAGDIEAHNMLGRCYENGWGVAKDTTLARAWYRKSGEGGYFRGAYNYATMLAVEGCLAGATLWFERALATAPEPWRANMIAALSKSTHAALRAIALGMNAQTGATEGLI